MRVTSVRTNRKSEPSQELLDSIREHGVLNPIVLRGKTVVDGVARLNACKQLGIKDIPVRKIK